MTINVSTSVQKNFNSLKITFPGSWKQSCFSAVCVRGIYRQTQVEKESQNIYKALFSSYKQVRGDK